MTPAGGPERVAGVDVGIIHPFAVACGDDALVVSGRAVRAEDRLHLDDTKARARKIAPKQPPTGTPSSRRYRRLRRRQRAAEARHKRRVRHCHHVAAKGDDRVGKGARGHDRGDRRPRRHHR